MEQNLNTLPRDLSFIPNHGMFKASDRTSKTILGNDILIFKHPPLNSNISITDSINSLGNDNNTPIYSNYGHVDKGNINYYIDTGFVNPLMAVDSEFNNPAIKQILSDKTIVYDILENTDIPWNSIPWINHIPRWFYDSQNFRKDIRVKQLNKFIRQNYIPGHLF